jgi:hypothetical protein
VENTHHFPISQVVRLPIFICFEQGTVPDFQTYAVGHFQPLLSDTEATSQNTTAEARNLYCGCKSSLFSDISLSSSDLGVSQNLSTKKKAELGCLSPTLLIS